MVQHMLGYLPCRPLALEAWRLALSRLSCSQSSQACCMSASTSFSMMITGKDVTTS